MPRWPPSRTRQWIAPSRWRERGEVRANRENPMGLGFQCFRVGLGERHDQGDARSETWSRLDAQVAVDQFRALAHILQAHTGAFAVRLVDPFQVESFAAVLNRRDE